MELGLKGIKIGTFDLPNAKIVVDGVKSGQVAFAMDRQQYLMGYYAAPGLHAIRAAPPVARRRHGATHRPGVRRPQRTPRCSNSTDGTR